MRNAFENDAELVSHKIENKRGKCEQADYKAIANHYFHCQIISPSFLSKNVHRHVPESFSCSFSAFVRFKIIADSFSGDRTIAKPFQLLYSEQHGYSYGHVDM